MPASRHFEGRSVVRWGIIGCGDVTEVKSGPGFRKAARSGLVAVMRRNGALAADYARRHGVARWYDNAEALIADPEVDAVYIATLPDTHASYALAAARAGKPALVEKPMARNAAECDAIVDAFRSADLPLFVAYYLRSMPYFVRIAELIKGGAIGRPTGVTYRLVEPHHRKGPRWRTDVDLAGSGHFLDVGSHALDMVDYLLGPIAEVHGVAANTASDYDAEDAVSLSLRTASGVVGSMSWNFAGGVNVDTMQVTGTEGEVTFPMFNQRPIRVLTSSGERLVDEPYPEHVAQPFIQSVVDELLGTGSAPSTGESGRRASRVMDKVLDAYYGGRSDAFWARPSTWPGRRPHSRA
jgi:predicted dehydrogenase